MSSKKSHEQNKKSNKESSPQKSKEEGKQVSSPHTNFFEYATSLKKVARGLLIKHLPKELLDQIDLDRISTEKTSFISKHLKKNISDCLIKAYIKDREAYIIELIEAQSTNDPLMPFRVLEYMVLIWRNYIKEHKNATTLPLIYPVVISNSREDDTRKMPISLGELFEFREVADSIISFKYKLVDLLKIPDQEFNKDIWADFLEKSLKYNRELTPHEAIKALGKEIQFFSKTQEGIGYIEPFLCYNIYNIDQEELDKVSSALEEVLGKGGKDIMGSAVKKFIDEGRAEGEYKKAVETAKNMLADGVQILSISKYTGLSINEVNKIKIEMGL